MLEGQLHVYVTDVNGKASLVINLYPGTYNMYYCFEGSSTYNPMHGSTSFTSAINTRTTTTVNNLLGNTIFQNNNLLITLRDNNNNMLPVNTLITLVLSNGISSVNYYKYTDSSGNAYLPINLNAYTYGITLIYEGSSTYKSAMKIFNLTVFNTNQIGTSHFNTNFNYNGLIVSHYGVGQYIYEYNGLYLNQTYHCEVNDPIIQNLASSLTLNCYNDLEKANVIFNFVKTNIINGTYYGDLRGAIGTYRDHIGNCLDHASLTIALARASGIPAIYASFDWYDYENSKGHAFALLLIGGKWVIADSFSKESSSILGGIPWESDTYFKYNRVYMLQG